MVDKPAHKSARKPCFNCCFPIYFIRRWKLSPLYTVGFFGLGQIISRAESRNSNPTGPAPRELFYRYAGKQMGMTGNNGTSDSLLLPHLSSSRRSPCQHPIGMTARNKGTRNSMSPFCCLHAIAPAKLETPNMMSPFCAQNRQSQHYFPKPKTPSCLSANFPLMAALDSAGFVPTEQKYP
jgi:hypothetical protein